MSLPFLSLNAASQTGPGTYGAGSVRDLEDVSRRHTMIVTVTGYSGPGSNVAVALEGSHDGTSWAVLANLTGQGSSGSDTTAAVTASDHLVRYVRADFGHLNSGTSATVTATIATLTEEDE